MTSLRIIVADAQPLFAPPDSGRVAQSLVDAMRRQGHDVDSVVLPYHPAKDRLLDRVTAWRMLNLSISNARPVDLVVALAFPSWFARHPRKVAWIVNEEMPSLSFSDRDDDRQALARLTDLDSRMLTECHRVFATTRTADSVKRSHRITPSILDPPSAIAASSSMADEAAGWTDVVEQLIG